MQARNVKLGQKTVTCYPVVNQNDKILLELLVELSVGIRERVAVGSIDWLGYQCRKVLYRKIKILFVLSFEKSITIIFFFLLNNLMLTRWTVIILKAILKHSQVKMCVIIWAGIMTSWIRILHTSKSFKTQKNTIKWAIMCTGSLGIGLSVKKIITISSSWRRGWPQKSMSCKSFHASRQKEQRWVWFRDVDFDLFQGIGIWLFLV